MARIPTQKTITNASSSVINAIRNVTDLKNYIPVATPDADSLRKIGNIIIDSPDLRNTYCDTLVNRIAKVILMGRTYQNNLARFKKGVLDYGEIIEEVFVDLLNAVEYDIDVDADERNKVVRPSVKSAFHVSNFRKHYDVSISRRDLARAFESESSMVDLIEKIIGRLYDSMNYDEFLIMKYLVSASVCTSKINAIGVGDIEDNPKSVLVDIKDLTNRFTNMSTKYNVLGVHNTCPIDNQILILSSRAKALVDVQALATLFHLEKGEMEQRIITVDDWGDFDGDRVKKLLGNDYYYDFSDDELSYLTNDFYGVLVDEDFFQVYDHEFEMDSDYNGVNQVIKYCLHKWSTFAISGFVNAMAFTSDGSGSIKTITLSVDSVNVTTDTDGKTTTDISIDVGGFVSGTTSDSTIYNKLLTYSISGSNIPDGVRLDGSTLIIPRGSTFTSSSTLGVDVMPSDNLSGSVIAEFSVNIVIPE